MKKIILILSVLAVTAFIVACGAKNPKALTMENYPLKGSHVIENLACEDCHTDVDYTARVPQEQCFTCHIDYEELAALTADLGYDDNIHASPHYPKMDCALCHKVHTPSTDNYCVMCHSQPTMLGLIVP